MADAYASEKYEVGSFQEVGYTGPGTKVSGSGYLSNEFGYTEGDEGTWQATARHKLDECAASTTGWTLTAVVAAEGATNAGDMQVTTGGEDECLALTPAFEKLARSTN